MKRESMSEAELTALGNLPRGPGIKILRAAEADAWRDGHRFLAAASQSSEQIRQAATAAYEAEHARGYADGQAEGAQESTRLVNDTVSKVDRYLATLDQQIAGLVMDVVRRVLGEFDAVDLISRAATRAIADFRREKFLTVTVHPEVLARVRTALAAVGGIGPTVTVEGDPRLDKEACVVASEFAVIDASIETQLAAIADAFGTRKAARPGAGP
jgi:type III secretion protein L